jgi:tRNA dimethylallyltransferase
MSKNSKQVIIIAGPTATGKTELSIAAALKFNAEVVNFDSLYFYQELQIGTARPSENEMQGITHHLIGFQTIKEPLNAADYQPLAVRVINEIHQKGKAVILTGGSGFYLQTLLKGMYPAGSISNEVREKSDKIYLQSGIDPFIRLLQEIDPKNFNKLHTNDHYRIRRAIEHYWQTGEPFSKSEQSLNINLAPAIIHNWNCLFTYLDIDKVTHQKIINERTEKMLEAGLVKEVTDLLGQGYSVHDRPLGAVGYKQVIQFLNGEIANLAVLKEKIIIATRQLAKAQRTWFAKWNKTTINPLTQRTNFFDLLTTFFDNVDQE